MAPAIQPDQGVGIQPDNQVAGSSKDTPSVAPRRLRLSDLPPRTPQAAGSSRGITGSSAPGWHPDIPSMPSDPSELRTSPYPSRHSEQRDPSTATNFQQHLESLDSPLIFLSM